MRQETFDTLSGLSKIKSIITQLQDTLATITTDAALNGDAKVLNALTNYGLIPDVLKSFKDLYILHEKPSFAIIHQYLKEKKHLSERKNCKHWEVLRFITGFFKKGLPYYCGERHASLKTGISKTTIGVAVNKLLAQGLLEKEIRPDGRVRLTPSRLYLQLVNEAFNKKDALMKTHLFLKKYSGKKSKAHSKTFANPLPPSQKSGGHFTEETHSFPYQSGRRVDGFTNNSFETTELQNAHSVSVAEVLPSTFEKTEVDGFGYSDPIQTQSESSKENPSIFYRLGFYSKELIESGRVPGRDEIPLETYRYFLDEFSLPERETITLLKRIQHENEISSEDMDRALNYICFKNSYYTIKDAIAYLIKIVTSPKWHRHEKQDTRTLTEKLSRLNRKVFVSEKTDENKAYIDFITDFKKEHGEQWPKAYEEISRSDTGAFYKPKVFGDWKAKLKETDMKTIAQIERLCNEGLNCIFSKERKQKNGEG